MREKETCSVQQKHLKPLKDKLQKLKYPSRLVFTKNKLTLISNLYIIINCFMCLFEPSSFLILVGLTSWFCYLRVMREKVYVLSHSLPE